HEPRREPQRDAIVRPEGLAPAAGEADRPRVGERLSVEVGEEDRRRLIIGDEAAAIDMTVAGAVLERDSPLPPGLARQRLGIGPERVTRLARHREGGIAR